MKLRATILFIYIISLNSVIFGQKLNDADSTEVCKITNDFFNWYLGAINGEINSICQPKFIAGKDSMTTLDFKDYFDNLKKHNCSDFLIEKERKTYNVCIKNLEKIKFVDFDTQYTDLDQFEEINCDFGNYYRWTGGQEPIQGIRITKTEMISSAQIKVTIDYYFDNGEKYGLSYWGNNEITLTKNKNIWKIDEINWRNI